MQLPRHVMKSLWKHWLYITFAAVLCVPAQGKNDEKIDVPTIAVLELQGTDIELKTLELWTRTVRIQVINTLGRRAEVMTAGNQDYVLKQNGIDAAQVCDGTVCDVELLRNLSADYGFSGSVTKVGKTYIGSLTVYDTESGAALGAEEIEAEGEKKVRTELKRIVEKLCRRLPFLGAGGSALRNVEEGRLGGSASSLEGGAARVFIEFTSSPPGATVMDGIDPVCNQTPCRKKITKGVHEFRFVLENHRTVERVVKVKDDTANIRAEMKPTYAVLRAGFSKPPGKLTLNGKPVAVRDVEQGIKLPPGVYELWVEDPCFVRVGERMALEEADVKAISFQLQAHRALVDVVATDSANNDVEVKVYADGSLLGTNAAPLPVPICTRKFELDAWGKRATVKLPPLETGKNVSIRVGIGKMVGDVFSTTGIVRFPNQDGLAWREVGSADWKLAKQHRETEVRPGKYDFEVALPGRVPETRQVNIGPGQVMRIREANETGLLRPEWSAMLDWRSRLGVAAASVLAPAAVLGLSLAAASIWERQLAAAEASYASYQAASTITDGARFRELTERNDAEAQLWAGVTLLGGGATVAAAALPVWLFWDLGEPVVAERYPTDGTN